VQAAWEALRADLLEEASKENPGYGQRDDDLPGGLDLFSPIVAEERQHPSFKLLATGIGHSPARETIREMMVHLEDVDGNFVEQLQSSGFDARLWGNFTFSPFFREEALEVTRPKPAPDFRVERFGEVVHVEAVIAGPRGLETNSAQDMFEAPPDDPSTGLIEYLYGTRHDFSLTPDGQLVISPIRIEMHRVGNKEIPSGFFFLPRAENISAVIFSNSGPISKFTRMGKLAGFGDPGVRIIRRGTRHNHDANSSLPIPYSMEVELRRYSESWPQGISPRLTACRSADVSRNVA